MSSCQTLRVRIISPCLIIVTVANVRAYMERQRGFYECVESLGILAIKTVVERYLYQAPVFTVRCLLNVMMNAM